MQPLYEVVVSRPWHWGIVFVSAPGAAPPEVVAGSLVAATTDALAITVRHAQDIDAEVFDGDWEWATARIQVRSVLSLEDDGTVAYTGELSLPAGRLTIGDADSTVTVDDLDAASLVQVRVLAQHTRGATDVRVDVAPRGG
ncbi:hypothetical protein [Thalassiella azotivora]